MATPLTVSIPPLRQGQKIAEWEPKFRASVVSLEEAAAKRLLPAYLCRGKLEERVVLEAIQKDTLENAFKLLKERLDPPADIFEAIGRFRLLVWPVGEQVYDFFAQYLEEGLRAGLSTKQVCMFMISQLPMEVRQQAKDWVNAKEGDLPEEDGARFAVKIRDIFLAKGISLTQGYRELRPGKVTSIRLQNEAMELARQDSRVQGQERIDRRRPQSPSAEGQPESECSNPADEVYVVRKGPTVQQRKSYSSQQRRGGCYICNEFGHGYKNCPKRLCWICGQQGHKPWDCPKSRGPRRKRQEGWRRDDNKDSVLVVGPGEGACSIQVRVGDHTLLAMLDTGARPSVIDRETLQNLRLERRIREGSSKVFGLCDAPVDVIGYVDVEVCVGTRAPVTQRLQVLNSDNQVFILGREFMRKFGAVAFDFQGGIIKLGNTWEPVQDLVSGSTPLFRAQISNDQIRQASVTTRAEELINVELGIGEIRQLEELLDGYPTLFAGDPTRPSRVDVNHAHSVELQTDTPIRARPRRIPPAWEEEITRQVDEMCENGICRPSKSPWGSDVVLVRKKDGRMRFAVDYRLLNSVTKRDAYGPPNPQSILDKLEGSRYFSCLDLASAYWCVPMREQDIEKTAFHTPRGLYEMLVMPFGMVNSGATFQRLMDNTLQGIKSAESYIDDILIFSVSFDIKHLREVFRSLQDKGIQLREDKCRLAYWECEFLGHHISNRGREPVISYLDRVKSFPNPGSLRELQRFLGTLNYYRCYIPKMANIAAPLYKLTEKGSRWKWTPECELAFATLRDRLTNEPVVLAFPQWNKAFYVEVDASATGVGAVLSQRDPATSKFRPICYYSSSLSPSQKSYSAGQLEAWALVSAARKWSVYLRAASEVVFLTDHCPLQWLRSQKDPRHTYARWILELESLPYRVEYRPGSLNQTADYLSRIPHLERDRKVDDEAEFEGHVYAVGTAERVLKWIVREQLRDPVIQKAVQQWYDLGSVETGQLKKVSSHLYLKEGVLYFDHRFVVPTVLRKEVLERVHALGHFGIAGTLEALRRSYYWPKMARDVKLYCRGCVTCQRVKPSHKSREPIRSMLLGNDYPGRAVAMDIGTLPWADGEYRYFLVIVDLFTRLIEVMPLRDQTTEGVITAFEQGWIYRGYGVPEILVQIKEHSSMGSNSGSSVLH